MSKGLKRLSVVVTVLWLFASLYLGLQSLEGSMEHRWDDPVSYDAARTVTIWLVAIYWATGTAAWWALMYAGSWIARGFEKEKK